MGGGCGRDVETMKRLLLSDKEEAGQQHGVNSQNQYGCTPLHLALQTALHQARATAEGEEGAASWGKGIRAPGGPQPG